MRKKRIERQASVIDLPYFLFGGWFFREGRKEGRKEGILVVWFMSPFYSQSKFKKRKE